MTHFLLADVLQRYYIYARLYRHVILSFSVAGVIRSYSDRTYRINEVAKRYTWNQTITFDECTLDSARAIRDTMRVAVTRNFVVYDSNDRVVRYAMSNKVGLVTGITSSMAVF